jgi:hypothetical protein
MNLSNIKATTGLNCKAIPSSTNVVGTVQIGANPEITTLTATVAYSLQAFFSAAGNVLSLNRLTGSTSGSTAYVAGNAQVETATAAGTVSAAGNATITVTSAGMAGSPKAISVAVAVSDTPTLWAAKVRTALTADTAVGGRFTVSGATTAIILTRKPTTVVSGDITHNIHGATDATLNIAIATGTATGITAAATSADTTVGVATAGVLIYDGDGKDFEGTTIPTMASIAGELYKSNGSAFVVDGNVDDLFTIGTNGNTMFVPGLAETTYTYVPTGPSTLQITVLGNV